MKRLLILLFVVLSVIVYCNDPYFTEENVNLFIQQLESEGFIMQQGTFYSFDMPDLFSNYITPSCYGNNAEHLTMFTICHRLPLKLPRIPSLSLSDLGKMKLWSFWDGRHQKLSTSVTKRF